MRRFEDHIDLDASIQDCVNTWVSANHYPHFTQYLTHLGKENNITPQYTLDWDLAANSTEAQKILWWHYQDNMGDYSGIVSFREIHHGQHVRVTLIMTWNATADNKTSYLMEANMGLMIRSSLESFKQQLKELGFLSQPKQKVAV